MHFHSIFTAFSWSDHSRILYNFFIEITSRKVIRKSMKPATSLPGKKGKVIFWITVILALLSTAGWYYYSQVNASTQTADRTQAQTEVVQRGDLTVSASGTGTLIAQTDASFGFEASGQVTGIYVKIGDQVEAGQILAEQDDTLAQMNYVEAQQTLRELYSAASIATVQQEIGTAQDTAFYAHEWIEYLLSPEVIEAEENLAIAEQKLAEAQAEATANPSDAATQIVKEKEQAVAYLQDKLTQAQEYYENYYLPETFGTYENVGSRRHPKQVLATAIDPKTGEEVPVIDEPSAADITTARNNYAQAQETVKQGELYLEALNTGVIPEGATGEKITALYEAQLALENAQSALDAAKLVAPISGTVTSLDLSIGEQVDTDSVITISQLSQPYTLEAYLDERDWSVAKIGNKVNITFDLLLEQTYPGTVTLIYPELSESFESSLVHLVVQLDQSLSQDLPAGTGATVDVVGGEAMGVVLVPLEAVHETEDGKSVVTVLQNGQPSEREVELGLQTETYAEIKSGLEAGEIVVTE
jgi:RND family efflux transporter MFP subunit